MKTRLFHQRWFQILFGGMALFVITEEAFRLTGNPNYFPTLILVGAFTVPVAFVTYFYEHVRDRDISLPLLTTCFIVGGIFGLIAAGILEYGTLRNIGVLGLFGVGLIEEGVKLIFPMMMYIGWKYRHEADGLLFGVAAGMGFAALETMGYGLVSLIQSRGDVGTLQQVLLLRGLLSPAGHAAWTGFVCAIIWRERAKKGRGILSLATAGAFVLAVVLHALWNIINSIGVQTASQFVIVVTGSTVIAGVSLFLIILRFRRARDAVKDTLG